MILTIQRVTQAAFDALKESLRAKIAQLAGIDEARLEITLKNSAAEAAGRRLLMAVTPPPGNSEIEVSIADAESPTSTDVSKDRAAAALESISPQQLTSELKQITVIAVTAPRTGQLTTQPTHTPTSLPNLNPIHKPIETFSAASSAESFTQSPAEAELSSGQIAWFCVCIVLVLVGLGGGYYVYVHRARGVSGKSIVTREELLAEPEKDPQQAERRLLGEC